MDSGSRPKFSPISLLPLAGIYLLWFITSFLVFQLGLILPYGGTPPVVAAPLSLIFFITIASFATAIFIVYQDRYLRELPILRHLFILFTVIVGVVLIVFIRQTNNTSSIVLILFTANLLVFSMLIGTWIVTPLRRPAELVLVCVVMSVADLLSVIGGPTKNLVASVEKYYTSGMKGTAPLGDFLLVKVAVPGLDILQPVFGVADWIIIAFLGAAVVKFKMNDNLVGKSLGAMIENRRMSVYLPVAVLGLVLAVFLAQVFNIFLPALPLVSLCFLTYILVRYPETRMLTSSDWTLLFLYSGVMVGLMFLIRM